MFKILDCTLRDGGYYTNWDFENGVVEQYLEAMESLPVDYLEIGYRNNPTTLYLGEYGYCPVYRLKEIKKRTKKKIAIMLNEKDVRPKHLHILTQPIIGIVDMIRIAIDPKNMNRSIELSKALKDQGFEVCYNVMYMSKWEELGVFSDTLSKVNKVADLFYMVDSFGSVTPTIVSNTVKKLRNFLTIPIGFHAHNNLELALSNTLTAIECNINFVDCTVLGMGRGAGNLKTELLLTYLNKWQLNFDLNFNVLGNVVSTFTPLINKYKWGINLPYMISGANSFQQKEVMAWVNNRTYSFNNIVRALNNKKEKMEDNHKYPILTPPESSNVIIIGGGESALRHLVGIKAFIEKKRNISIIHATSKNSKFYLDIDIPHYFCLVGSEAQRMKSIFDTNQIFKGECILPPYPRLMGTDVPSFMENRTYELKSIDFTEKYNDSCTAVALQLAISLKATNIYVVGYDGYPEGLSQKEMDLTRENETLIRDFIEKMNKQLVSLTPTLYENMKIESLYQNI